MRFFTWVFSCTLALSVSGAELRFNFGDTADGSSPTNFHAALAGGGAPGTWKVITTETPTSFAPFTPNAPTVSRGKVLAQTAEDLTDEHFPMCVFDGETFGDFKFSTRFKIVSGTTEQMAGLVFRFQNSSNFYVARASALGHNVRFYKVVDGLRSDPIGPLLDVTAGEWHSLAVQCEGNQIRVFYDDKQAIPTLGDNTFTEGKIGFWTKSDSVSYFTEANVSYTPRIPAAQRIVDNFIEKQPRIHGLRIYTLETNGTTRVIASKVPGETGQAGGEAELKAIQEGTQWFGREDGDVVVTLALRDHNGENIGAMRVKLKSFLGETQNNAVNRAMQIRKQLEEFCTTGDELRK